MRLVADVSIATGIGPNDLLSAPPEVFDAIVALLEERAEQENRQARTEQLRSRLNSAVGR